MLFKGAWIIKKLIFLKLKKMVNRKIIKDGPETFFYTLKYRNKGTQIDIL